MEKMTTITDDELVYMVAEEVKNRLSPVQRKILLNKENWERWQQCLLALVNNLNQQLRNIDEDRSADEMRFQTLGSRRMLSEATSQYKHRQFKIERFKFHVEKRLDEVTTMIETGKAFDSNGWEEVEFLKRAIAKHREMLREYDMEPTPIDEALWSALIDKWEFDKIDVSQL
jgi:hypothetical protein